MTSLGTRLSRVAAGVPLSLAASCGGITGPFADRRPDPSPAAFWVTVRTEWMLPGADGRPVPAVRVEGGLETGVADDGRARSLVGAPVVQLGREASVPLRPLSNGRSHTYETTLPVGPDGLTREPLVVSVPALAGLAPVASEVRLRAPMRAGPDSIALVRGAALRLPLRPSAAPLAPAPDLVRWALVVQGPTLPALFQVTGTGPLPAELVVPAEYLRTDAPRLTVSLSVTQEFHTYFARPEPPYDVRYRVETPLHWTVGLTGPAAAP